MNRGADHTFLVFNSEAGQLCGCSREGCERWERTAKGDGKAESCRAGSEYT